jgi:F-type H+-transporting ATPase subunit b
MINLILLIALVVLIVLVWKPVTKNIFGALDARAERIRAELDEAQRLHEEAKALLAKYQGQLQEGEKLATEIVSHAETERTRLEERMRADFEAAVKRRTEQAMERIQQEEQRALAEVRARAADLAVRTARRLLTERIGEQEAHAMVRNAVQDVSRRLA